MHSKIISISAVIIIFINTLIFFKVENFKNKNKNILIKKENKHSIGLLKKKEMQTDLIIKYEPLLPLTAEEQAEYKENKKLLRVKMCAVKKLFNKPLFKSDLKKVVGLENMSILKNAQGTNFPVNNSEWKILSEIINNQESPTVI